MFFITFSGQKTLMKGVACWILEQKPENSARFHIQAKQNFKDVFNLQPQWGSSVGNIFKDKPEPGHYAGLHHMPSDATQITII